MSTLISYLLAAILQFIGASMPTEQETVSVLTHQQCEITTSVLPYSFIINNEQESQKLIRNK
jgi:predicted tellurium resistance membrane protein TerC